MSGRIGLLFDSLKGSKEGKKGAHPFVVLIKKWKKSSDDELGDVLKGVPTKKYNKLWESIQALLATSEKQLSQSSQEKEEALVIIETISNLIEEFLKDKDRKETSPLVKIVQQLHGLLLSVPNEKVQDSISRVCERWWKQEREQRQTIIPQTVSYLVIRSLQVSKAQDIKRVYNIRDAISLLDLEHPSSQAIKYLLLRCMIHPPYLRSLEGRRLLSFAFGYNIPFINEIHAAIKNQIPNCRNSLLKHYGDIYFRAWKLAEGQVLIKIENCCIQDLMYRGVNTSVTSTSKSIRVILNEFHRQKKQREVDEMLSRLYGPVLWRSLSVANPIVRHNALALFIDAFPLTNPDANRPENDELLQKQFNHLETVLTDNDVNVRALAAKGVCHVIGEYWELIPSVVIKKLLTKVMQLTFDASSSLVRTGVFEGLGLILQTHLSHSLLKPLLPKLAPLIHDKAEKVVLAFLDLLIYVSKLRSIRFFDIVPLDELLLTLQKSTMRVQKKLTQLLLNSYFPYNKPGQTLLGRALAFIRQNFCAASYFYANVHHFAPSRSICKLIVLLYRCLIRSVKEIEKKEKGEGRGRTRNKEGNEGKKTSRSESKKRTKSKSRKDKEKKKEQEEEEEGEQKRRDKQFLEDIMDEEQNSDGEEQNNDIDDGFSYKYDNESDVILSDVGMGYSDQNSVDSILCIMSTLWESIRSSHVPQQFEEYFEKAFGDEDLQTLLRCFPSDVARGAIFGMASRLRSSSLPTLTQNFVPQLSELPESSTEVQYGPSIECMFAWKQQHHLYELIEDSISPILLLHSKKSHKKNNVLKSPILALRFLAYILKNNQTRQVYLCDASQQSNRGKTSSVQCAIFGEMQWGNDHCSKIAKLLSYSSQMILDRIQRKKKDDDDDEINDFLIETLNLHFRFQFLVFSHQKYAQALEDEKNKKKKDDEEEEDGEGKKTKKRKLPKGKARAKNVETLKSGEEAEAMDEDGEDIILLDSDDDDNKQNNNKKNTRRRRDRDKDAASANNNSEEENEEEEEEKGKKKTKPKREKAQKKKKEDDENATERLSIPFILPTDIRDALDFICEKVFPQMIWTDASQEKKHKEQTGNDSDEDDEDDEEDDGDDRDEDKKGKKKKKTTTKAKKKQKTGNKKPKTRVVKKLKPNHDRNDAKARSSGSGSSNLTFVQRYILTIWNFAVEMMNLPTTITSQSSLNNGDDNRLLAGSDVHPLFALPFFQKILSFVSDMHEKGERNQSQFLCELFPIFYKLIYKFSLRVFPSAPPSLSSSPFLFTSSSKSKNDEKCDPSSSLSSPSSSVSHTSSSSSSASSFFSSSSSFFSPSSSSLSTAALSWEELGKLLLSLVKYTPKELIQSNTFVRRSLLEIIKGHQLSNNAVVLLTRLYLECLVNENNPTMEEMKKPELIETSSQIDPIATLMLGVIMRCMPAISALPKVFESMKDDIGDGRWWRMIHLLSAIIALLPLHIKIHKKRIEILNSLRICVTTIEKIVKQKDQTTTQDGEERKEEKEGGGEEAKEKGEKEKHETLASEERDRNKKRPLDMKQLTPLLTQLSEELNEQMNQLQKDHNDSDEQKPDKQQQSEEVLKTAGEEEEEEE